MWTSIFQVTSVQIVFENWEEWIAECFCPTSLSKTMICQVLDGQPTWELEKDHLRTLPHLRTEHSLVRFQKGEGERTFNKLYKESNGWGGGKGGNRQPTTTGQSIGWGAGKAKGDSTTKQSNGWGGGKGGNRQPTTTGQSIGWGAGKAKGDSTTKQSNGWGGGKGGNRQPTTTWVAWGKGCLRQNVSGVVVQPRWRAKLGDFNSNLRANKHHV